MMPSRLPSRQTLLTVYDMREQGYLVREIADAVGRRERTIWFWLSNPHRYDPYFDEVALERAMNGERKVYDRLTVFEMEEFYNRLEARMQVEPYDNKIHHPEFGTTGMAGTRSSYWLHDLVRRLGFEPEVVMRTLRNRRQARAKAA